MQPDLRCTFPIELDRFSESWMPTKALLLVDCLGIQPRSTVSFERLQRRFGDTLSRYEIAVTPYAGPTNTADLTVDVQELDAAQRIHDLVADQILTGKIRTVVIDATTMPTHILLFLCQQFAWRNTDIRDQLDEVVIVYTMPEHYAPQLGGGFLESSEVPGFPDGLIVDPSDSRHIGWIPIFGFSWEPIESGLRFVLDQAEKQERRIAELNGDTIEWTDSTVTDLRQTLITTRTYPIIGWPPYRPDFHNRALWENRQISQLADFDYARIQYAAAGDPYDTAARVLDIVSSRSDLHFYCSVQGSQPMNIGCGLASSIAGSVPIHSFPTSTYEYPPTAGQPGKTVIFPMYRKELT